MQQKETKLTIKQALPEFTNFIVTSLVSKNWIEYQSQVNSLTCEKALKGTQVSKFRRTDDAMLRTVLHLMVEDVFAGFGASEKIAFPEIARITSKILTSYWWLKIEELAYVFNKGKQLHYGKVYGIPSEVIILSWINQYDMFEREAQCAQEEKDKKDAGKMVTKLADAEMHKLYQQKTEYKNIGNEDLRNSDRFKDERIKDEVKNEEFKRMREEYFKNRNTDASS